MTPQSAVRAFCHSCVGSGQAIPTCGGDKMIRQGDKDNVCFLYPYRLGKGRVKLKAIKLHCRECWGGKYQDVLECNKPDCALYDYRLGRNPKRAGMGNIANILNGGVE